MSGAPEGPAARLAALGLTLPPVTAPVAAYVPAVRTGSYIYVSGQLPVTDGKLPATGKVGGEVSVEDAAASLLGFLQVEEGDVLITEDGREFANSEILKQKDLFRKAALVYLIAL